MCVENGGEKKLFESAPSVIYCFLSVDTFKGAPTKRLAFLFFQRVFARISLVDIYAIMKWRSTVSFNFCDTLYFFCSISCSSHLFSLLN